MRIIILGSSGIVGTGIKSVFQHKNCDLYCPRHDELDITDISLLHLYIKQIKPDIIINCVGYTGIQNNEEYPDRAFQINAIVLKYKSEICNKYKCKLIHISTSGVFDGSSDKIYYKSSDTPDATDIYGISKSTGERIVESYCNDYLIVRIPFIFGSHENSRQNIFDRLIYKLKNNEEILAATDHSESFSYNKDIGKMLYELIKNDKPNGIYHIANSGIWSFYDVMRDIQQNLDKGNVVPTTNNTFGRPPVCVRMVSDVEPIRSTKMALEKYIQYEL